MIEIMSTPMDNNKFFEIASKFSTIIEAEHTGFGVIFTKGTEPALRQLVITPAEEAELAGNQISVLSIRVKKRIELYEAEENKFQISKEAVFAKILRQCSSQLRTVLENEGEYEDIIQCQQGPSQIMEVGQEGGDQGSGL